MSKQVKSMRLSCGTITELEYLANLWGISQSDVIATLIHLAKIGEINGLDETLELIRNL
jgi:hypothetical protein